MGLFFCSMPVNHSVIIFMLGDQKEDKLSLNVLFISIDNLRFDCVGYQPFKDELRDRDVNRYLQTPTLDALAEESLCFTQCLSTSTYTTASHASILTGLYPPGNGVRAFFQTKVSNSAQLLSEVLRQKGYRTILFTDIPYLFDPLELNRGFEFELSQSHDELFCLLDKLRDEKVFLFVHLFDVHEPYMHNTNSYQEGSNEDYLTEMSQLFTRFGQETAYDREMPMAELWSHVIKGPLKSRPIDVLMPLYIRGVTKFDTGRFRSLMGALDGLGFSEDAFRVIFSDHGEGRHSFRHKSCFGHAGELFDNVLRVPLMMRHPDLKPQLTDALVSTVDIFPTVLALLGIDFADRIDGLDILSSKRSEAFSEYWEVKAAGPLYGEPDSLVPSSLSRMPESKFGQMAVRTSKEKFVFSGTAEDAGKQNYDPDDLHLLDNEQLVRRLYTEILRREPDPGGLAYHVERLNRKLADRNQVISDFHDSEEYQVRLSTSTNDYFYLDLDKDPSENRPLNPYMHPRSQSYFETIREISLRDAETKKINLISNSPSNSGSSRSSAEERAVIETLRSLGYF